MTVAMTQPEWRRDCLLAANRQLETRYRLGPSACIALQISRNYRLLLTQYDQPDKKQFWLALSQHWWDLYCQLRSPSQRRFSELYPIIN